MVTGVMSLMLVMGFKGFTQVTRVVWFSPSTRITLVPRVTLVTGDMVQRVYINFASFEEHGGHMGHPGPVGHMGPASHSGHLSQASHKGHPILRVSESLSV